MREISTTALIAIKKADLDSYYAKQKGIFFSN